MADKPYIIYYDCFNLEGNKKTLKEAYECIGQKYPSSYYSRPMYITHVVNGIDDITWCHFNNKTVLPWSSSIDRLLINKFHPYGMFHLRGWYWAKIVHAKHQSLRAINASLSLADNAFAESVESIMDEIDFSNYIAVQ